jgi:iron-sulfur cluster insertion protein
MIYITEKAAEKIKEISDSEGIGYYSVRVKVQGGGCAGFTYDLFFDDKIVDMDEVAELDGVKVIIDPLSFQYMDEVTMDYIEGTISAGFKFLNPNVKGTCGCGNSYSF